jgi:hypothetical protein
MAKKKAAAKKAPKKSLKDKLNAAYTKMEKEQEGKAKHSDDCPCGKCA